VSKNNNVKQNDTDVFRAEDIIPPYHKEIHQEQDLQETEANKRKGMSSQNELKQSLKDITSPLTEEKSKYANDFPGEPAGAVPEASEPRPSDGRGEIPKFDLAEQIMAEQRKITAIRRKAPCKPQRLPSQDGAAGKKTEPPAQGREAESIGYTIQQPPLTLPEQGRIIAEIVARDIKKLRRGDTSNLRRPGLLTPLF